MRTLLILGAAAIAACATSIPAAGQGTASGGGHELAASSRHDGGHNRRHQGRFGRDAVIAGPWGYYDFDANAGWRPDSFNDWWHDRPDRAYPRWVQDNQNCAPERQWWSGSGWHC